MKSKKAQRILLICVLVVWGLIVYRVFIYMKKDETVNSTQIQNIKQSKKNISTDSLVLLLNYTDPFCLSKILPNNTKVSSVINSDKNKTKSTKINESMPIPKLIYKGTIYNQIKQKNIGIVQCNQNSIFISEGDSIQSWIIAKIYKDSLLITHSKQRVCISISK